MNEADFGRLIKAYDMAARQHVNQRRKDKAASPYINHPVSLVTLLWEVGGVRDVNILIAAVLHDTLEDTVKQGSDEDFALQAEIRQEFGEEVLSLVKAVTDDKSLPKEERKKRQIEHAASTPPKAKLIKLADKISNVTDIAANPPKDWSLERRKEYLNWAKAVVDAAQADSPNLVARFEQVYRDGMRQLQDQHAAGI